MGTTQSKKSKRSGAASGGDECDELRRAVTDALTAHVPVQPLIEIIVQYSRPFRGTVTTLFDPAKTGGSKLCPMSVCVCTAVGIRSYVFAENARHVFREVIPPNRFTLAVAGSGVSGVDCGPALQSRFNLPFALCPDPINPNRLYVCDQCTIRVLDRTNEAALPDGSQAGDGVVTHIAGAAEAGYVNGRGSHARFAQLGGLVCTSDGGTLIAVDSGNRLLRSIAIDSGEVTTLGGNSMWLPQSLTIDRTTATPDTVLYVAAADSIVRFIRQTGAIESVRIESPPNTLLCPFAVVAMPNGSLLFSCVSTNSLYLLDPSSGRTELMAGSGVQSGSGDADGACAIAKFNTPCGLCLDELAEVAIVADQQNGTLRRVTLSSHLFHPPTE